MKKHSSNMPDKVEVVWEYVLDVPDLHIRSVGSCRDGTIRSSPTQQISIHHDRMWDRTLRMRYDAVCLRASQGLNNWNINTGYAIYLPLQNHNITLFKMQNYLALTLTLTAGTYATLEPCPSDLPLSCQNTTAVPSSDSCCFNAPGGALLLTQFWDTDPVTGPVDSWTIHGLWYLSSPPQKEDSFVNKMNRPDNCDGSYQQYCDSSREYTDISGILKDQGRDELLSYMNEYWLSDSGDDEEMWEHEFGKHGLFSISCLFAHWGDGWLMLI